jgi:hypothetical protein
MRHGRFIRAALVSLALALAVAALPACEGLSGDVLTCDFSDACLLGDDITVSCMCRSLSFPGVLCSVDGAGSGSTCMELALPPVCLCVRRLGLRATDDAGTVTDDEVECDGDRTFDRAAYCGYDPHTHTHTHTNISLCIDYLLWCSFFLVL